MKNSIIYNLYNSSSELDSGLKRIDKDFTKINKAVEEFDNLKKDSKIKMLTLTAFNTSNPDNRIIIKSYNLGGCEFTNSSLIELMRGY